MKAAITELRMNAGIKRVPHIGQNTLEILADPELDLFTAVFEDGSEISARGKQALEIGRYVVANYLKDQPLIKMASDNFVQNS